MTDETFDRLFDFPHKSVLRVQEVRNLGTCRGCVFEIHEENDDSGYSCKPAQARIEDDVISLGCRVQVQTPEFYKDYIFIEDTPEAIAAYTAKRLTQ